MKYLPWLIAAVALAAIAAWPHYVNQSANAARASSLPTMAPVVADYKTRDRLVAFWEKASNEHHRDDMISPRMLSGEYLQRYRERGDIGDVLRAEAAAKKSLRAQPRGNLAGELALATVYLTLHRFYDALAITKDVERWDAGDQGIYIGEASLDLEVGNFAAAAHRLAAVHGTNRNDAWRVVESRYLELTGHLAQARELLATAAAYQNSNFDAPAQSRAWYFFRQGEMAFEAGDNDAALAFEHEAVTVFPHYADGFRVLARIECSLHQWQQCLADGQTSSNMVPYPETLGFVADAQTALGDTKGAQATNDVIRAVERIGNTQHISDRLLAIYYSEHGIHLHDAYRIARRELKVRDDVYTEDTLGWAAAMDGHWAVARRAAARATAYGTQDARIQFHAGMIALHFGEREEARKRLEMALKQNRWFHPLYAEQAERTLALLAHP